MTRWRALRPTIALVAVAWVVWACSGDESCSGAGVHAIVVEVREAGSGTPICEANLHVTAPGYDRTHECTADGGLEGAACCTVYVLGDPNTYTIDVVAPGFVSTSKQVFVPEGDCDQPVTQHVTIEMTPQ